MTQQAKLKLFRDMATAIEREWKDKEFEALLAAAYELQQKVESDLSVGRAGFLIPTTGS